MEKKELDNLIKYMKENLFHTATLSDPERKVNVDMENKLIKVTDADCYEDFSNGGYAAIYTPVMEFYSINQRRLAVYECTLEKLDKKYQEEVPINTCTDEFILERYVKLFYAINYLKKINYKLHFPAYQRRLDAYKQEIDNRGLTKQINDAKRKFRLSKDLWFDKK